MRHALTSRSSPPWSSWLLTSALAALLIVLHARLYQYAFDDAYIHFRVARNLIETGAPYYNPGEAVKVSTSSAWTLILAALFCLARLVHLQTHFPLVVAVANALVTLYGALVYTRLIEAISQQRLSLAQRVIFQFTYTAFVLPASIGLMETSFALLLAGWGLYAVMQNRPAGFAILCVAAYVRLELFVLLGLAGLFITLRKTMQVRASLGGAAIGLVPLLAYDIAFFRTVVPQSIVAKGIVYSIDWYQPLIHALLYSLPAIPLNRGAWVLGIGIMLLLIVPLVLVAALKERTAAKGFWPLLFCLWGLLVVVGYVLGRAFVFDWYVPLYTVALLVACTLCSTTAGRRSTVLRISLLILFVMATISLASAAYAATLDPGVYSQFEPGARVRNYLNIGATLNEEYPTATLLTSEIGALGYSFRGRILDAAGLASPDALKFHPMRIPEERADGILGAIPPGYVRRKIPDLIVSYDAFAQALMKDDVMGRYNVIQIPAFLADDFVHSSSGSIWGSQYVRVYIRKDLPISARVRALGE